MKRLNIVLLTICLALAWQLGCEATDKTATGGVADSNSDSSDDSESASDADSDPDDNSHSWRDSETDDTLLQLVCPNGEEDTESCYCLRLGVIGIFESSADDDDKDVTAFVDWLNTQSSAVVTMVEGKPTITDQFLSDYDILLLLYQTDNLGQQGGGWWNYSADESAALKSWLEAGGGIVTVTGFDGYFAAEEVGATNSLLQPATGLSYNADQILTQCEADDLSTTNNCGCWVQGGSGTVPPIRNFEPEHPISKNVSAIGSFYGYSINVPTAGRVVASEVGIAVEGDRKDSSDPVVTVASVEVGEGRAVAIADEWCLFTNLWMDLTVEECGFYMPTDPEQYASANCYMPEAEQWMTPQNYFQHPQFWFNTIQWAAPENECFTIESPQIIID